MSDYNLARVYESGLKADDRKKRYPEEFDLKELPLRQREGHGAPSLVQNSKASWQNGNKDPKDRQDDDKSFDAEQDAIKSGEIGWLLAKLILICKDLATKACPDCTYVDDILLMKRCFDHAIDSGGEDSSQTVSGFD